MNCRLLNTQSQFYDEEKSIYIAFKKEGYIYIYNYNYNYKHQLQLCTLRRSSSEGVSPVQRLG
jgi:hypothetical protein